jgi:tRNA(Ile2) C34 agmatinyltransferase TiaS
MRAYIGFDDTDNLDSEFGTGKLARRYEALIPEDCRVWGVVRQQLLVDPGIPYTSHNSSACVIVDFTDPSLADRLIHLAIDHIERKSARGSDPGLCMVCEDDPALHDLMTFGRWCTERIVTQKEALQAAGLAHLSGHGGTNDGIIGAAAAVGLTASGWSGRFIEYADLRQFPDPVSVGVLLRKGIRTVSLDRDALCPGPDDLVNTKGWLRPRLWGCDAVLPVLPSGPGLWDSMGEKRKKNKP